MNEKEVIKLSKLARVSINKEEAEDLSRSLAGILKFVSSLDELSGSDFSGEADSGLKNVMRDDDNPNSPAGFSADILELAPAKEKGFIKVKTILKNED